jgi:hypothetical protein
MPAGAPPIEDFVRFYVGTGQSPHRTVIGVLLNRTFLKAFGSANPYRSAPDRSLVQSVDKLPSVFDGGCGVVHVEYDLAEIRFRRVFCNAPG